MLVMMLSFSAALRTSAFSRIQDRSYRFEALLLSRFRAQKSVSPTHHFARLNSPAQGQRPGRRSSSRQAAALMGFDYSQNQTAHIENDSNPFGDDGIEETTLPNQEDLATITEGTNAGFYVVRKYELADGFDSSNFESILNQRDIERLELTETNISLPVALMMVDPFEYPSLSRARKACRNANILIHRGPLLLDSATGEELFDKERCLRGRVGDRVFPKGSQSNCRG